MANHKSAEKRFRQIKRRTAVNRVRKSKIKRLVKMVETALGSQDHQAAVAAFRSAEPELARGVTKGLLHKNTVARKVSRLSQRIKAIRPAS